LRVISGSARGRKLHTPKNLRVRPTSDRVKEALFNILAVQVERFDQCRVLDIFAGTGNLGIEAMSRGAASAIFIDNHRESAALTTRNLQLTGFDKAGKVVQKDVFAALQALSRENVPFQLIFIDPPYERGLAADTLERLAHSSLLDARSIVVAEYSAHEQVPTQFGPLRQFDTRCYGDTVLSLYRLDGE
jgi:16S rRNA (guanine(966)-N(2))-methyltransferase RsmD